jgi:hypothetical protein
LIIYPRRPRRRLLALLSLLGALVLWALVATSDGVTAQETLDLECAPVVLCFPVPPTVPDPHAPQHDDKVTPPGDSSPEGAPIVPGQPEVAS